MNSATISRTSLLASGDNIEPTADFDQPPDALPQNTKLDAYSIGRVLSPGGFSIAYNGHDPALDIAVVIKEYFPPDRAVRLPNGRVVARGPDRLHAFDHAKKRFRKEGLALAQMNHENIVRVYRTFDANNTVYLVLEKVEGVTLRQWLADQGPKGPDPVALQKIMTQMFSALDHAHSKGIVHCDLKADNVIIKPDGKAVLIDFGGWRRDGLRDSIGSFTPAYSPPEFFDPNAKTAVSFDIYALGATFYEAITGEPPPLATVRTCVSKDPYQPLTRRAAGKWPRPLLTGIDKSLATDRQKRHADIRAFEAACMGTATDWARPAALAGVCLFAALLLAGMLGLVGPTVPTPVGPVAPNALASLLLLPALHFVSRRFNQWAPLLLVSAAAAVVLAPVLHPDLATLISGGTLALAAGLAALMLRNGGQRAKAENSDDAV